jgi:hypothetical protein
MLNEREIKQIIKGRGKRESKRIKRPDVDKLSVTVLRRLFVLLSY